MQLFVAAKGIVVHEQRILLLRESGEYQEGTQAGKWDVPGGRIEANETVTAGLQREIVEETGLHIQPDPTVIAVYDHFADVQDERCHMVGIYYFCRAEEAAVTLSGDHDEHGWFSVDEALELNLVSNIDNVIEACRKNV